MIIGDNLTKDFSLKLVSAINQFIDHQHANGRSKHTIYAYRHDLELLVLDLPTDIRVDRINQPDIDQFFITHLPL